MQTLTNIKSELAILIKKSEQFGPITLSGIEKLIRSNNPNMGLQTTEIRIFKKLLPVYEANRSKFNQFISALTKKMMENPSSEAERKLLFQELFDRRKDVEAHINILSDLHSKIKDTIEYIIDRINYYNQEKYFKNLSHIDSKRILSLFSYYQFVFNKFESAINELSQKLNSYQFSSSSELDMKVFSEKIEEIEMIGDLAFEAQNDYEVTLTKEAWQFAIHEHQNKLLPPIIFSKKKSTCDNKEKDDLAQQKSDSKERKEAHDTVIVPKNGMEYTLENYHWLSELINAYKEAFNQREQEDTLLIGIPEEQYGPSFQLKAFIRHVFNNPNSYDTKIKRIVQNAINHIGGSLDPLDEAFNDNPDKQYGVFKCEESLVLLDNLQDFINEKIKKIQAENDELFNIPDLDPEKLKILESLSLPLDEEDEDSINLIPSVSSP